MLFDNITLTPVINDQPLEPVGENEDGSDENPSDLNESDDEPAVVDGHTQNLLQGQFNGSFSDEWILTGDGCC